MEGSQAIAEAMVNAGCRFFAGYPMTPFTEVLEHMARLLPTVDGVCINAESELEAVGMAWGAAASGTRSATGSVGQGISLMQESLSELCNARVPIVVFNMARGQGDYFQATRGGGHGDYRHIVLAPADVPEAVYLTQLAFHLSDLWRNPVVVFGDYYLGHVMESVDTSPVVFAELPVKDWALDGTTGGTGNSKIVSPLRMTKGITPGSGSSPEEVREDLREPGWHIARMVAGVEPLVELGFVENAELVVVAYGTPGRYLRYAVNQLRAEGVPVGFVRPITLWPFPTTELASAIGHDTKAVAVFEMNAGQMIEDVQLAILGRVPVIGCSLEEKGFGVSPDLEIDVVVNRIRGVLDSASKERV